MSSHIQFKSSFPGTFYLMCLLITGVLALSLFRFFSQALDLAGLVFLNGISFLIGYYSSFRFDCRVSIDNGILRVKYLLPFREAISIDTEQINDFEKQRDAVKRYYKRIIIKTVKKDYVIEYNISDESDEKLQNALRQLIVK